MWRVWRRWGGLDRLAAGFALAGAVAAATGALPAADAGATLRRIAPLLVFLAAVVVLADLTARAEVFDVLAARVAVAGRGSYPALFGLCVLLASATTIFLNLDTTAVLLTPVMLATAAKAGMPGPPLAMLTAWLANTASLLLPVSNLTNLLAADRTGLSAAGFAARMALPALAAIAATAACLWLFFWRRGRRQSYELGTAGPDRPQANDAAPAAPAGTGRVDRYDVPPGHAPADRVLFRVAALACLGFVAMVLVGVPLPACALVATAALGIAFVTRDRAAGRWRRGLRFGLRMFPVRLLVLVTGLFLVVQTIERHGLGRLLGTLIGTDPGAAGVFRAAGVGAGLSNLINNLGGYVAGEAVVAAANHAQLLGLLAGSNAGPLVTPWASLAVILWYERCRLAGVRIGWRTFALTGLVTAVASTAAAAALIR
jgi:arsenical pump membrane protein